MSKCITHNNIAKYLKKLSADFLVYFPVKLNNEVIFTTDISHLDKFCLELPQIPPKEFFLPSRENLLFGNKSQLIDSSNNNQKNTKKKITILFGLHPLDIHALTILDKIFSKNFPDIYYWQKKENVLIVGIGDYIFDQDFNCDLFLESNGDTYEVILKNPKSHVLLDYPYIFKLSAFTNDKIIKEKDPLFSDPGKLAKAVKASYKSSIWDDLAQIDLGCGICSYTCPLCYCFDLEDNFCFNAENKTCRTRNWSNCFKSDFFTISRHNFRPKLRDRIYNWYHHKFVRMYTEVGHVGCIDCGRCIKYCPAKINFKHVLKSILDDYEKSLLGKKS